MLNLIKAEEYDFLNNDVRFNLLIPLMQKEHWAYKSDDGVLCVINGSVMVVRNNMRGAVKYEELSALIKQHNIKKVFSSEEYICGLKLNRIMIPYFCVAAIKPIISGQMLEAKERHTTMVANMMEKFDVEMFGSMTKNYIKIAYELIKQGLVFIWQDKEITSMCAVLSRNKSHARLNYVYTREDMRRKGYAKMLTYSVACNLLKESCMPVLYTDKNCTASNTAYVKIGFKALGEIYEYDVTN